MARRTLFLETAFWDGFSECSRSLDPYAEGNDPYMVMEKNHQWLNLYKFICQSRVFIDTPFPELTNKAENDPMLRRMLKSSGDGRMELEYQSDPFPDLESDSEFEYEDDYSSVYLTFSNHQIAARKHGVINISFDSIWNQQNKFVDSGEAVKADKGWSWNKMNIITENSNSMVIIDNFVLTPDRRTGQCSIRYDLRELLRKILPDTFNEEYTLSVFYFDESDDQNTIVAHRNQFYQIIKDFVKAKKPNLKLNLELFPTTANRQTHRKDFHDRTIITNNVWIGSEAGFDLMVTDYSTNTNTRAIKTTKTHGLYLGFGDEAAKWLNEAYDHLISEAKQCLKKYRYRSENRILL